MKPILGRISDDFTGGTDLANILAHSELATTPFFNISEDLTSPQAHAIVISLKCRSIALYEAINQAKQALKGLQSMIVQSFSKVLFYFWRCMA